MTTVDIMLPTLEKIVRLEGSTEPKHRAQLDKLLAGLPEGVPLMWSYRRVAEFNVKRARLEKALENNRAAVKEAVAAEEARIAAKAWQWAQGRQPPNPEDAPDVKRGRELIASMEAQLKELTVASRLLVALVEGVADGERELKAIRDWRLYGGAVPTCVERDTAAKHEEMGLEVLGASPHVKVHVDPAAWIDNWNLPVPEEEVEEEVVAETPPPAPVVTLEPVKQKRDYRRLAGEDRKAFARRVLFAC